MKKLLTTLLFSSMLLSACSGTVNESSIGSTEPVTATAVSTTSEKGYLETKTLPYIKQQLDFYDQIWSNNWSKVWVGHTSAADPGDSIGPKMEVGIQRYEDFIVNLKEVPMEGLSEATKTQIELAVDSYSTAAFVRAEAMQYSKEQLTNGKPFSFSSLSSKVDEMTKEADEHLLIGSTFLVDVYYEFGIPIE